MKLYGQLPFEEAEEPPGNRGIFHLLIMIFIYILAICCCILILLILMSCVVAVYRKCKICIGGRMISFMKTNKKLFESLNAAPQQEIRPQEIKQIAECAICMENNVNRYFSNCGHVACDSCLNEYRIANARQMQNCHICNTRIAKITPLRFV
eukprot:TRINITY_DN6572_c0_g1_i3.p1 TRINITY_DN6572_c0_g1~~TRINITY_DN6572_c0_g1_i3.p1  ORF type:complete len:152 (-),score=0.24 TRINITY_DN6572_c0_g1_i3:85-540(-)